MKHIVREINILTYATLAKHEFDTAADAIGWATSMNEAMRATPIRYRYCNETYRLVYTNSKGTIVHKTFTDIDEATAFTAILDKRIERGTCGGYTLSTQERRTA